MVWFADLKPLRLSIVRLGMLRHTLWKFQLDPLVLGLWCWLATTSLWWRTWPLSWGLCHCCWKFDAHLPKSLIQYVDYCFNLLCCNPCGLGVYKSYLFSSRRKPLATFSAKDFMQVTLGSWWWGRRCPWWLCRVVGSVTKPLLSLLPTHPSCLSCGQACGHVIVFS